MNLRLGICVSVSLMVLLFSARIPLQMIATGQLSDRLCSSCLSPTSKPAQVLWQWQRCTTQEVQCARLLQAFA